MKVETKRKEKEFEPIELTITIEGKEDLACIAGIIDLPYDKIRENVDKLCDMFGISRNLDVIGRVDSLYESIRDVIDDNVCS